ncbi:tyrosine-type recombinase/integrase [Nocardioides donggukensis]|uniref:Site-specific integrase n=1 Tax=Nocardioides donggukensis TaxID=2774019 RepID=A0A927K2H9_9ACTN|nr:tyrosine-type recombinase/integrase [Nocardioides donggukensis]MBD8869292.1 site-specific integrase [Nocardioides donggukensis]
MAAKMQDGLINRTTTGKPNWSFLVRVNGKAKWHSGYPTKKAAREARDAARVAAREGTYVGRSTKTVGEWCTEWLETYSGGVTASTRDSYGRVLRLYVTSWPVADVKLQHLNADTLTRHWATIHASGGQGGKPLSARTVQYASTVLTKALNRAVKSKLIPHNPAPDAERPRGDSQDAGDPDAWSHDALAGFLAATAGHRLWPLWVVMAYTGLRRGEALALRWDDVDLDAGNLRVSRAVSDVGHGATYGPPKTKQSARTVPLTETACAALRDWRKAQAAEQLAAGPAWTTNADAGALVFTMPGGRCVAPSYATKVFARCVSEAGAPALTLHGLRHTFATHLLRLGTPVHTVSRLLGHASPVLTLNTYAHVIPGDESAATDALDRLVNGE